MSAKKYDPDSFLTQAADLLKTMSAAPNIGKYKPHQKQHYFHSCPKKRKLYIGGNRSGKTTAGICEGIWRATGTHPYRPELNNLGPTRGRVVGVDFTNGIDKILVPQYKQWCRPSTLRGGSWETAFDKGSRTLHFSNGSFIEFMSYDQDLDKFAGTSRHWVHFDEEPPRPIWGECMARLIDTNGEYWMTMTPVEGMTWIYDEIYEPNVNNPDGNVEVIEINTLENPYLSSEAITEFVRSIDDDDDVATRVGGAFVQQGGRVYKNFDPTPGVEQVLKEPIDDPKTMFPSSSWLWIMGLDHGLNNPTAVLWMAVDTNGFCVVFDEHYQKELTVEQQAMAIKRKIAEHGRAPDIMVADPSIKNRSAITATSIHEEYIKYGLAFILGNNDVKAGIVRVKKYLNKQVYVGVRRPELFEKSAKNPLDEFYKLQISPRCVNLIWEMKRYRWKTYANKKLQYENNPYDEPHKKDDHACDALRYMIMTRPDIKAKDTSVATRLDDIMVNLNERIVTNVIDDPNEMVDSGWSPLDNTPGPQYDGWTYDEHMGGMY